MAQFMTLKQEEPRTLVLVLGENESVTDEIDAFAAKNEIRAAAMTAIGAFRESTLGYFDPVAREYVRIPVREQAEVLLLDGDIGRDEQDNVVVHAKVVLGLPDGTTRGGYLMSATVWPGLKVMVTETPGELHRMHHKKARLSLIDHLRVARAQEWSPEHPLRHGLSP